MDNLIILEVAYHRNGVGGEPFHVVRFADAEGAQMIGIVFADPMCTAILSLGVLPGIAFGQNSWRGDLYDAPLRTAIAAYEDARSLMGA